MRLLRTLPRNDKLIKADCLGVLHYVNIKPGSSRVQETVSIGAKRRARDPCGPDLSGFDVQLERRIMKGSSIVSLDLHVPNLTL